MAGDELRGRFAPYVANMLAVLLSDGSNVGTGSAELNSHPGFWDDLSLDNRPSEQSRRHSYPFGFAKTLWRLRDQLAVRTRSRVQRLTIPERVEMVRVHEAMVRALESERILGSFHYVGNDPFPLDTVDLVADNLVGWLDHQGFAVVPKERVAEEPRPDVDSTLPAVFDPGTGTVRLRSASAPGDARIGSEQIDAVRDLAQELNRPGGHRTQDSGDRSVLERDAGAEALTTEAGGARHAGAPDPAGALEKPTGGTEEAGVQAGGGDTVLCPYCDGVGEVGSVTWWGKCPACKGSGRMAVEEAANFDPDDPDGMYDADDPGWDSIAHFISDTGGAPHLFNASLYDVRGEASPGVAWKGLDLGSADLSNLDLSDANFSGCILGNLAGANLSGANLARSSLGDLSGAVLDGADLSAAELDGATLDGASLRGTTLDGASLEGASFDLADLSEVELAGRDLTQTSLRGAILREARLTGTKLAELDLSASDLSGADLRDADLTGVNLEGAKLRKAIMVEAEVADANLSGSDMTGADLRGAQLRGAILKNATLRWARMEGSYLDGADLEGADLTGSDIERAEDLTDANLAGGGGLTSEQREVCARKGASFSRRNDDGGP